MGSEMCIRDRWLAIYLKIVAKLILNLSVFVVLGWGKRPVIVRRTDRQTNRQTGGQTDRQTADRQTGRQTDRQNGLGLGLVSPAD